jgi:hypothetical protein
VKVAFDIHGVTDTFEVFREMIRKFCDDPSVEVHIVTGSTRERAEGELDGLIDLDRVDGFFSITDHLQSRPDVEVKWINGLPWADETAWNNAKADYCYENQIDILFDDSPVYGPTFDGIDTIFCQVHNPFRESFKTRPNTNG